MAKIRTPKYELGQKVFTIERDEIHYGTIVKITQSASFILYGIGDTNFIDTCLEKNEPQIALSLIQLYAQLERELYRAYPAVRSIAEIRRVNP